MEKVFAQILDNAAEKAAEASGDKYYIGEDGLKHCSMCNAAVQVEITVFGITKIVPCICKCEVRRMEAEKEQQRREEIERRRRTCFSETNMAKWTFENDDRQNPKLSEAMERYADQFKEFRRSGQGLLLSGGCGTGKTFFAACIANRLIDNGYRVLVTNFARLSNQLQGMFEGKQEYIDDLNRYDLLVLDDLGAERKSEYMQEMVFNIIDSRYRSGLPMIITTNLSASELYQPQDVGRARIYDRLAERCIAIPVTGNSRRKEQQKAGLDDMRAKLGL